MEVGHDENFEFFDKGGFSPLQASFVFYIEKWKGSPKVRSMDADEKIGYLNLLLVAAEQEDGGIPMNPQELAILSEMEEQWFKPTKQENRRIDGVTSGSKVLGCWFYVKDGESRHPVTHEIVNLENKTGEEWKKSIDLSLCREGRYYNAVLLRDHQYRRAVNKTKKMAGQVGAIARWGPKQHNQMAYAIADAIASATKRSVSDDGNEGGNTTKVSTATEGSQSRFPYQDNFKILWDLWPSAGRTRKERAYDIFVARINEISVGNPETQYSVIVEGFEAWKKSALWSRGAIHNIANWLNERLYLERPTSADEDAQQRQSITDAIKNPGAEMVRRRLEASKTGSVNPPRAPDTVRRLGPTGTSNVRVMPIIAEAGTGGGVA